MASMNYAEWYIKASSPFRGRIANTMFRLFDAMLVGVFAGEYVATAFVLFLKNHYLALLEYDIAPRASDVSLVAALLVPAFVLVATSLLRTRLNMPRPYEEHGVKPLLARDTAKQRKNGGSCPSRHMSCAVIIAFLMCVAWPGIPTLTAQILLCAAISFTRVVGGVHYPRDIAAAVVISLICGCIGFLVIP